MVSFYVNVNVAKDAKVADDATIIDRTEAAELVPTLFQSRSPMMDFLN